MPKFRSQLWEIPHRENCFTVSIIKKERRKQWCNSEEVWKQNLIIFLHTNSTVIYIQLCKLSHYYPKYLNTDNSDVPTKGVTHQSWLPMSTCTTLWASQIRSVVSFKIHRDFSLPLMWCCESPVTTLTGSNNKKKKHFTWSCNALYRCSALLQLGTRGFRKCHFQEILHSSSHQGQQSFAKE